MFKSLGWVPILEDKSRYLASRIPPPQRNDGDNADARDNVPKIDLPMVEKACDRYNDYCASIENVSKSLFNVELVLGSLVWILSSLRCNPMILRLIVGRKSIRAAQPLVAYAFGIAKYIRTNPIASIAFEMLGYLNLVILCVDFIYGVYLWYRVRKEVLFLHFELSKRCAQVSVRNILISLTVYPISAFAVGRLYLFNGYASSEKIKEALNEVKQLRISMTDEFQKDSSEENTLDFEAEYERESLELLDRRLIAAKPVEMREMETVLELLIPTFCLIILNLYLMFAGLKFVFIFTAIFVVTMFLVIWFQFSANIGMILPVLIPIALISLELVSFTTVGLVVTATHFVEYWSVFFVLPMNIVLLSSLCWKPTPYNVSPIHNPSNAEPDKNA